MGMAGRDTGRIVVVQAGTLAGCSGTGRDTRRIVVVHMQGHRQESSGTGRDTRRIVVVQEGTQVGWLR